MEEEFNFEELTPPTEEVQAPKKKRGRKPKSQSGEGEVKAPEGEVGAPEGEASALEGEVGAVGGEIGAVEAPKKRRGRKPKAVAREAAQEAALLEGLDGAGGVSERGFSGAESTGGGTPISSGASASDGAYISSGGDGAQEREFSGGADLDKVELGGGSLPGGSEVRGAGAGDIHASDNYDEDAEFEKYNRKNREREINKRNDEFSYTASSGYEESAEEGDDEIPTSFKTSDEDLMEDSYRYRDYGEESEDSRAPDSDSPREESAESPEASGAQSADLQDSHGDNGQQRQFFDRNKNRNQQFKNQRHQPNRPQQNQNRQLNQNRQQQNQNRQGNQNRPQQNQNKAGNQNRQQQNRQQNRWLKLGDRRSDDLFDPSAYIESEALKTKEGLEELRNSVKEDCEIFDYASYWGLSQRDLQQKLVEGGVEFDKFSGINGMFGSFLKHVAARGAALKVSGVLDVFDGNQGGAICFACDSYRLKKFNVYVPQKLIDENGLLRGCEVSGLALAPAAESKAQCPLLVKVERVMDMTPDEARALTPFNELTPYYPTRRIILETDANAGWDNLSMRVVDLLTPLGLGQRALIVAPPRTGKTVLMQGMAKAIRRNVPSAHVIVLMVDERPEEVTDFKRTVDAEIIASTFDEDAFSHVHAAEMVISKARRMVEAGKDVVILLDSITRLARAYNTLMPNSGKIMSGGVEANALQKPKRFFGSARNIEGGGSLTIIGTALVETGSKMDEVIFEEFKGTGNLELHLDRSLVDKRIFPAINIEKSGTRKEELLYHPDEMAKIYSLRRAMKGVPSAESMELLIQRLKKVKTNVEFLMGINR